MINKYSVTLSSEDELEDKPEDEPEDEPEYEQYAPEGARPAFSTIVALILAGIIGLNVAFAVVIGIFIVKCRSS